MNFENIIGQIVDGKYKIERQLGKGGMGTVYLATHVGTERPVAVKVIAPQFMKRAEFVERFRREARAAGRLRHPNVVDVTDFGYCRDEDSKCGEMAYLVMEYLDGCTLGEILEEEKQLPLGWSLDILEQVCSAVGAAHAQGIIHRDLKPDNIWLEPNQRGGYTVKVLDFGIAKLEAQSADEAAADGDIHISVLPTNALHLAETVIDNSGQTLAGENGSLTLASEAGTAILTSEQGRRAGTEADFSEKGTAIIEPGEVDLEGGTAILPARLETQLAQKEDGTRHINPAAGTDKAIKVSSTADLTRVGAVLGTPLYMSPEQCRGERLSARSDIYSLAVIAYQMLGGRTPFEGDFTAVMQAHKDMPPPPLTGKKIPRKIKKVIGAALAKNPGDRPQTAEAFASRLRSQSEGVGTLLRRSLVIWSEHLPKFLGLATLIFLPVVFFTFVLIFLSFLRVSEVMDDSSTGWLIGLASFLLSISTEFCTYLIAGTTTWIVAQYLAVPLRPIRIRPALKAVKRKWKSLAWTGILKAILGFVTCGLGFLVGAFIWSLSAPVVAMENLSGWKALKRSFQLVRRSIWTTIATVILTFLVPAIISGAIYYVVIVSAKAFENKTNFNQTVAEQSDSRAAGGNAGEGKNGPPKGSINFGFGNGRRFPVNDVGKDMRTRVIETVLNSLAQILWLPMHVLVVSFTSIMLALLYLKTRQAGGESMHDLLEQFEEDRPQAKWQQRVQQRLIQSGRITTGKTRDTG